MGGITYQEYFANRTDQDLRQEAKGLRCAIYKVECYNTRDIVLLQKIEAELEHRKIKRTLERLNNQLADVFPSRHWAHSNIFLKLFELEKTIDASFQN